MAAPEGYTKLGKVGFNYRGEYDSEATYDYHDAVYYQGSTYVALCSAPPFEPREDGINWRFLARGTVGEMIESYADLMANTVSGYIPDALAVKEGFEKLTSPIIKREWTIVSSYTIAASAAADFTRALSEMSVDGYTPMILTVKTTGNPNCLPYMTFLGSVNAAVSLKNVEAVEATGGGLVVEILYVRNS